MNPGIMCLVKPYPEIVEVSIPPLLGRGSRAVLRHISILPGQTRFYLGPRSHHRVNVWEKGGGVLRRVRRKLGEVGRGARASSLHGSPLSCRPHCRDSHASASSTQRRE